MKEGGKGKSLNYESEGGGQTVIDKNNSNKDGCFKRMLAQKKGGTLNKARERGIGNDFQGDVHR